MNEKNLELYNQVRSVPDAAKDLIDGGRMSGKTSIDAMWRIKTLTEQFGPCGFGWYYVPVRMWTEVAREEILAFVDIELYVNYKGEWSKPIHGIGGCKMAAKEYKGINVSKECYKAATTDALSVACKQLGIGADVYWAEDKVENSQDSASAPRNQRTSSARPAGQALSAQHQDSALEPKYVYSLLRELARTGIGKNSLLRNYGKRSFAQLSVEEYRDAMENLIAKPDKPLNPQYIPPDDTGDPNSPWNQGRPKEEKKLAPVQENLSSNISPELAEDGYTYCGSFGGN